MLNNKNLTLTYNLARCHGFEWIRLKYFAVLPACLGIRVSPDHVRHSASNESFVLVLWSYRYIVTEIAKKLSRNTKNIPKLAPFSKNTNTLQ